MLKNYFIIALRNLARNKIYSFINIAGLSLGLACSMLIILYVKDEVSYDRFHAGVGQIYRITNQTFDKKEKSSIRMAIAAICRDPVLLQIFRNSSHSSGYKVEARISKKERMLLLTIY